MHNKYSQEEQEMHIAAYKKCAIMGKIYFNYSLISIYTPNYHFLTIIGR